MRFGISAHRYTPHSLPIASLGALLIEPGTATKTKTDTATAQAAAATTTTTITSQRWSALSFANGRSTGPPSSPLLRSGEPCTKPRSASLPHLRHCTLAHAFEGACRARSENNLLLSSQSGRTSHFHVCRPRRGLLQSVVPVGMGVYKALSVSGPVFPSPPSPPFLPHSRSLTWAFSPLASPFAHRRRHRRRMHALPTASAAYHTPQSTLTSTPASTAAAYTQSLPHSSYSYSPSASESIPHTYPYAPRRSDTQETMTQSSFDIAQAHSRFASAAGAGMETDSSALPSDRMFETLGTESRSSSAPFASVVPAAAQDTVAISHEGALAHAYAHHQPFTPTSTSNPKNDTGDLAQYLAFDIYASSPTVPALTPPNFGHQHASPPPASEVDPDGTSPSLSFAGSPSPVSSPAGAGASLIPHPQGPYQYSSDQPRINTQTNSPAFGVSSVLSPQLSGFDNSGGAYGLGLLGSNAADEGNMMYGYGGFGYGTGSGLGTYLFDSACSHCPTLTDLGDSDLDCAFAPLPWDNLLSGGSPEMGTDPAFPNDPSSQQHFINTPGQQFTASPSLGLGVSSMAPSGASGPIPMPPRLAPYTPPAIAPRDLELSPSGINNMSTSAPMPYWATQVYETPSSPSIQQQDGRHLLGNHGRSVSDAAAVLGAMSTPHMDHQSSSTSPYAFLPPPSAPAAIPIPSNANNNMMGGDTSFGASAAFAQLFQPASAPVSIPGNPSTSFMASSSLGFPSNSLYSVDSSVSEQQTQARGPNLRSRIRSVSQRVGSGLRDAQRAVFHTRAAPYPRDESIAVKTEQQEASAGNKDMEWTHQMRQTLANAGIDVDAKGVNMDMDGTLRVAFPGPGSSGQMQEDSEATVRRPRRKRNSNSLSNAGDFRSSSGPSSSTTSLLTHSHSHSREASASDKDPQVSTSAQSRSRAASTVSDEGLPSINAGEAQLRSELRPPKLAPSTWQLYFTDWIARHQMARGDRKLNVAQAAKEAGAEYAVMTAEQKEVRESCTLHTQRLTCIFYDFSLTHQWRWIHRYYIGVMRYFSPTNGARKLSRKLGSVSTQPGSALSHLRRSRGRTPSVHNNVVLDALVEAISRTQTLPRSLSQRTSCSCST